MFNNALKRPSLKSNLQSRYGNTPSIIHSIYFFNIHKETIFQIYDDTGCDLLSTKPDTIRDIYERYNHRNP
ncbi:DUF3885 domain-containing protein [Heyndrickxia oleronia]|uniref:DUF3885 domain-containing protein n=1 Tax=Heyndrickxia oleronia TaxID=38875 RepID=UPI003CC814DA